MSEHLVKSGSVLAPSDDLSNLRELIISIPYFKGMFDILPQLRFVIDSNIILRDLVWLVRSRRSKDARTSLQEAIDSGTLIAFAPQKLRKEILKHLPRRAEEENIPKKLLLEEWRKYEKYLRFCADSELIDDVVPQVVDPDDLPFICLYNQIGATAVISEDSHISAMGARTVGLDVIITIRNYARAKSVEVTIKLGSLTFTGILAGTIITAIPSFIRVCSRLPTWLLSGLLACMAVLILHPQGREAIKKFLHTASNKIQTIGSELQPLFNELIETLRNESLKAEDALKSISNVVSPSRRVTLKQVVYSVCLAAKSPLTVGEIEKMVFLNGYVSKSKRFAAYLRRVISQDQRFVRCDDGCWTITRKE